MQAFPSRYDIDKFLIDVRVHQPIIQFVLEIVRDLLQIHLTLIVNILIGQTLSRDLHSIFVWPLVVGAEPFKPEFSGRLRRLEMEERRDQVDLLSIILRGYAGKSEQDVPGYVYVVVEAPL